MLPGTFDDAEREPHLCHRVNADGAAVLACLEQEIGLVTFSSDLVFDGNRAAPTWKVMLLPLNVYGHSKAMAEMGLGNSSLLTSHSHQCFLWTVGRVQLLAIALRTLASGHSFAADDTVVSPTYVPDLVNATSTI